MAKTNVSKMRIRLKAYDQWSRSARTNCGKASWSS